MRGTVSFLGQDITRRLGARSATTLGIAHIPEDRQRDGMIGEFDIAENMVLDSYYDEPYSHGITHGLAGGAQGVRQERHRFRRAHALDLQPRRPPLRRQPAEADRGARAVAATSSW